MKYEIFFSNPRRLVMVVLRVWLEVSVSKGGYENNQIRVLTSVSFLSYLCKLPVDSYSIWIWLWQIRVSFLTIFLGRRADQKLVYQPRLKANQCVFVSWVRTSVLIQVVEWFQALGFFEATSRFAPARGENRVSNHKGSIWGGSVAWYDWILTIQCTIFLKWFTLQDRW